MSSDSTAQLEDWLKQQSSSHDLLEAIKQNATSAKAQQSLLAWHDDVLTDQMAALEGADLAKTVDDRIHSDEPIYYNRQNGKHVGLPDLKENLPSGELVRVGRVLHLMASDRLDRPDRAWRPPSLSRLAVFQSDAGDQDGRRPLRRVPRRHRRP